MKRSKANDILARRIEVGSQFNIFEPVCEESDCLPNHCEVCLSKGIDAEHCECTSLDWATETLAICPQCLVALVYGDNSDLDYYVTEEDI
jgi:hypothetical protein